MIQRKQVDALYALYEFEKDTENEYCSVYVYDQGYFNNAEIVIFDSRKPDEIKRMIDDYAEMGYSVSRRESEAYDDIKTRLFCGFFKTEISNKRVLNEYNEYTKLQSKRLGGVLYSYIESRYSLNGVQNNGNLVNRIIDIVNCDGAQLIILEAPAGFGKTCTSYEIAKTIAEKTDANIVPILAELSKNRTARIFRYVLLAEIDRKFPRLSSTLVTEQIKEGHIPLIIDGFDELLSRETSDKTESLEQAETMLDTIADFFTLKSEAKVVLTSRKSSILTGEVFDKWIAGKFSGCNISRIQIMTPTVADWIGNNKIKHLELQNITLEYISNPVLLAMLRAVPEDEFYQKFQHSEDVLENYFQLLLGREKDRQQLYLTVEEQRKIMRKLASMFVQLDISADESDNVQVLIEEIVGKDMDQYLLPYREEAAVNAEATVPKPEEFVMKLVHNALLDRVNINSNNIGFINEFIFGILIGDAIVEKDLEVKDTAEKYLSMVLTAYEVESDLKRKELYEIIKMSEVPMSTDQRITMDMNLIEKLGHDFVDEYFSNVFFKNTFDMQTDCYYFYNCTFEFCTFDRCKFDNTLFEGCYFISCCFYDVTVVDKGDIEEESIFISCIGHENVKAIMQSSLSINRKKEPEKNDSYYEKIVLEQYWMKGSNAAEPRRTYRTLCKGVKQKEKAKILLAVDRLIDRKILTRLTYCLELNFDKINEIKNILGRN